MPQTGWTTGEPEPNPGLESQPLSVAWSAVNSTSRQALDVRKCHVD
jgi:hypothetical protein